MYKLQNKVTGIISDTQIPGHLDDALEFTQRVFYDRNVQQIVHIGDLVDHHYISRWPTELDSLSPKEEWVAAKQELQRWVQAYPCMHLCYGNHDTIPQRRMEELGIPHEVFMKSLNDIYSLPPTWIWADSFLVFGSTLIEHGLGSGGMYGAKNTANKLGVSYVQGHTHAHAAVFNIPRSLRNAAAMNVGCLVDTNKYYSRYGLRYFKIPVSLGCGVVYANDHMEFFPYRHPAGPERRDNED